MRLSILILCLLSLPPLPLRAQPTKPLPGSIAETIRQAGDRPVTVTYHRADGTSASMTTTADKFAETWKTETPSITPAGGVTGGGAESTTTAQMFQGGAWKNPLLWLGILSLAGGAFCLYIGSRRGALILGVGGVALIVASFIPIGVWIAVAVVGVGIAALVYAERNGLIHNEALRAVVAGVENAPASIGTVIKTEIAKQADQRDKSVIAAVKLKDAL
jgi:hypothetical protein